MPAAAARGAAGCIALAPAPPWHPVTPPPPLIATAARPPRAAAASIAPRAVQDAGADGGGAAAGGAATAAGGAAGGGTGAGVAAVDGFRVLAVERVSNTVALDADAVARPASGGCCG